MPRTVEVVDRTDTSGQGGPARKAAREKADSSVLGSVGAPMAGEVIEVSAKPGLLSSWRYIGHFTQKNNPLSLQMSKPHGSTNSTRDHARE